MERCSVARTVTWVATENYLCLCLASGASKEDTAEQKLSLQLLRSEPITVAFSVYLWNALVAQQAVRALNHGAGFVWSKSVPQQDESGGVSFL